MKNTYICAMLDRSSRVICNEKDTVCKQILGDVLYGGKNHKLFANFHSNSVHFYNTDDRENEIFVKNLTFDLKMEFGQSNNEITMRLSS